jgi:hypothetical protein
MILRPLTGGKSIVPVATRCESQQHDDSVNKPVQTVTLVIS